ncbi:major Facilitator Superfamily protein [Burkholderia pseudomallei MSHR4377]|uniref:MFS transporter n=1 Tax=Burkholderia pseudomallei TaxID=28450 RepID=UPI000538D7E0|nr:MFS transporter [Burkholderia pseudomallei]KGV05082.1 major Facilitator Superfamily protein [Burkholderia pseudomallei MSHR4377]
MSETSKRHPSLVLILIPVVMLGQLSMDMYLPALDSLRASMRATGSELQLTLSAFVVSLGVSQFLVGEFARRAGRGRAIRIALVGFVGATAGCAITSSIAFFIVCRAVQGISAAVCVALSYAVIADNAKDSHESMRGMTMLTVASTVAPLIAPVAGSQVLQLAGSWRAVFVLLLCVASAATLAFFTQPAARFDARASDASKPARQIYLGIARSSRFWRYALLCSIGTTINFCFFSFLPGILLVQNGLTQNAFSAAFFLCGLTEIAGSLLAPRISKRIGHPALTGLACACCALGGFGVAYLSTMQGAVVPIVVAFSIVELGTGMLIAPCFSAALYLFRSASNEASAICGFQQFMIAAGVATFAAAMQWQSSYALGILIGVAALLGAALACTPAGGAAADERADERADESVARVAANPD